MRLRRSASRGRHIKLRAEMKEYHQAQARPPSGVHDVVSMVRTAEDALEEINSILYRMLQLSVQAAGDTLTSEDRACIQLEIDRLKDEIDKIAEAMEFDEKLIEESLSAPRTPDKLSPEAIIGSGLQRIFFKGF